MCIIIFDRRKQSHEPIEVFKRAAELNPHGAGLMYAEDEKLHIWRTMDDIPELHHRYKAVKERDLPIAVHFRKTTVGDTIPANVHPLKIGRNLAFMHNGTIDLERLGYKEHLKVPEGERPSDTLIIRDEVLRHLPRDFYRNPLLRKSVLHLTLPSRLFFMNANGDWHVTNEAYGSWEYNRGVWLSNTRERYYLLYGGMRDDEWADFNRNRQTQIGFSRGSSASAPVQHSAPVQRPTNVGQCNLVALLEGSGDPPDGAESLGPVEYIQTQLMVRNGPKGALDFAPAAVWNNAIQKWGNHPTVQGELWRLPDDVDPASFLKGYDEEMDSAAPGRYNTPHLYRRERRTGIWQGRRLYMWMYLLTMKGRDLSTTVRVQNEEEFYTHMENAVQDESCPKCNSSNDFPDFPIVVSIPIDSTHTDLVCLECMTTTMLLHEPKEEV